ncbi:MAG: hypothetical protein M1837_006143 [Sclerophora amabilis]|nr:MAG: hypothetical protein M1837_006143 [Sclerophora amabilis]
MIVLFFFLVGSEALLGDKVTRKIVRVADIPAGFALRYINIFFTPSFVLLPLSPPISGVEIGKIIGVFIIGFVAMLTITVYLVRGLQLVLGTSKRAITERAEEMGQEDDDIPLTIDGQSIQDSNTSQSPSVIISDAQDLSPGLPSPPPTQDPDQIRGSGGPPTEAPALSRSPQTSRMMHQDPIPLTKPQRWAAAVTTHQDIITYAVFLVFIGLPTLYIGNYAMPIHLSLNVLAYFAAVSLPVRYTQFLHPVLVSSAITILGIWVFALTKGESLRDGLRVYSTKTRYTQLFHPNRAAKLSHPGAGDILSSVLDVSIVALALPMFQYRNEMRRHVGSPCSSIILQLKPPLLGPKPSKLLSLNAAAQQYLPILLPVLVTSLASLFSYPPLCTALGISPARSLSFSARSLTLALANPTVTNLGGDLNLAAVLCIMSGILGVLIGPTMLKWLRVPEDDYITRGVSLGANSSAIATALLLRSDPRAAALSSLAMSLFGTLMVGLTSIPPVARVVVGLAGL